jgi:hypothetical protein
MSARIRIQVKHMGILANPVDALIVTYNPDLPEDYSGESRDVLEYGGEQFHAQLRGHLHRGSTLEDGAVVTEAIRPHGGNFHWTVFVPNNQPRHSTVYKGLHAADIWRGRRRICSVTLALFTGMSKEQYLRRAKALATQSLSEIMIGIGQFLQEDSGPIELITIADPYMMAEEMFLDVCRRE